MSLKATDWDDRHLAESPAVEVLQSLGYTYASPEDLETGRPSLKEPILTNRLATTLKRLNPCLSDTNVTKAVKAVTQVPAASLSAVAGMLYSPLVCCISLEIGRGGRRKEPRERVVCLRHRVRHVVFAETRSQRMKSGSRRARRREGGIAHGDCTDVDRWRHILAPPR